MKLDFHTHGKLAKRLPFSTAYTDWLFGEAKKAGLDAICLTEHFNTWQFDELYGYLLHTCHREGDRLLLANGLTVFPGMETDIAEGGHILSLGNVERFWNSISGWPRTSSRGIFFPLKSCWISSGNTTFW